VTLFVNGIPLVTMELKSQTQDNNYYDAISDSTTTRAMSPDLFNVAADTQEFRYGSVGESTEFYESWNTSPKFTTTRLS